MEKDLEDGADAEGLTEWDKCAFMKLYCDHQVGLGVDEESETGGLSQLSQNAPNPFTTLTTIQYHLTKAGKVRLTVSDIRGQTVATLVDDHMNAGTYTHGFRAGHDMPEGTYWYTLDLDGRTITRQMILVR